MKILGLIPARGGSKGVPFKNKKLLGGKPLISYSIATGLDTTWIHDVIVSTDDPEIAHIAESYGASAPFLRPEHLADDDSPTIDTVLHSLAYLTDIGQTYDAVCLLQPTVPFRDSNDMESVIETFDPKCMDSLVSMRMIPKSHHPHWAYIIQEDGQMTKYDDQGLIIKRRQDLPACYYRDGSIYLTATTAIYQYRNLYGLHMHPIFMRNSPDINIDTAEDWQKAEDYVASKISL